MGINVSKGSKSKADVEYLEYGVGRGIHWNHVFGIIAPPTTVRGSMRFNFNLIDATKCNFAGLASNTVLLVGT